MKKSLLAFFSLFVLALGFIYPLELEAKSSPWARSSIVRLELLGIRSDDIDFEAKYQSNLVREDFCELLVKFYLYVEGGSIERFGKLSPFEDTNNRYVIAAHKLGFVNGLSETTFGPGKEITREQVATMMARALGNMKLGKEPKEVQSFSDDNLISSWAKKSVYFCKANSIVQGGEGGKFEPKNPTTKEQLMKILDNTLLHFDKANIKMSVLDQPFGKYKIPSKSLAQLDYGLSTDGSNTLRITVRDEEEGTASFDALSAAHEIYQVAAPVIGHARARAMALLIKNEWSASDLSFSKNKYYGLDAKARFSELKEGERADVVLRFNGSFIVDIFK